MKNARLLLLLVTCLAALVAGRAHAQSDGTSSFNSMVAPNSTPENTATGKSALTANTTGNFNTATGAHALEKNSAGSQNTATGGYSLQNNASGSENTADGYATMNFNTTGHSNAALGSYALNANTAGYSNTASGSYALTANTTGCSNTAAGRSSLFTNASGSNNTATGFYALYFSTGSRNTAEGTRALNYVTTGEENTALGYEAGYNITTGGGNIDIGNQGTKEDDATIRLGTQGTQKQAFVAGIFGTTAAAGVPVVVTSNGQLGTVTSSAKFKRNIRDMGDVGGVLMSLRPVTFQYKPEIDPAATPQFGLVAEEVEKVDPDLVVHDVARQVYTVRYDAVNAMLLDEVQKQQRTIDTQQKLLEELARRVAQLEKR